MFKAPPAYLTFSFSSFVRCTSFTRSPVKVLPFQNHGIFGLVALRLFATVFVPFDVGLGAQDARAFFAAGNVARHEWADVHPHAVVDVGIPADGLLRQWLPADENVVRRLAVKDGFQYFFQGQRRGQPFVRAFFPALDAVFLRA